MSFQPKDEPVPPGIQKIIEKTKADFDEISTVPRFGFFSIPPNQILGDRYYSRKNEFNYKIVDPKQFQRNVEFLQLMENQDVVTMPIFNHMIQQMMVFNKDLLKDGKKIMKSI